MLGDRASQARSMLPTHLPHPRLGLSQAHSGGELALLGDMPAGQGTGQAVHDHDLPSGAEISGQVPDLGFHSSERAAQAPRT